MLYLIISFLIALYENIRKMVTIMNLKEEFIRIYTENIKREGAKELLEYLTDESKCDFFSAPASTRYHGAYEGGLLEHSINVYKCLKDYLSRDKIKEEFGLSFSDETIAIVALLHDMCKINVYKTSMRNVKDSSGQWVKVPFYQFEDNLPYGHGEKSVYMISGYMRLSRDEAFAVRYHMGFSGEENKNSIGNALDMFPLALALNIADMEATFLLEGRNG